MVFRSRNIHTKKGIMITKKILVTPGDGIGPEVTKQAIHVLKTVAQRFELQLELSEKHVGGIAYDLTGTPIPDETLKAAKKFRCSSVGCSWRPKMGTA